MTPTAFKQNSELGGKWLWQQIFQFLNNVNKVRFNLQEVLLRSKIKDKVILDY
jgi:hypothetical protein